ncbi:hypothetical protein Q5P01_024203 [Channa striata]|uniref:Aryl hydrocarbon receptor n=1 Tax=Channa striata TaxID=64152 RepID=A0AA88IQK5_CHASR|nr:hypothetical protein Q5P01_024203 [Channa striata]
MPGVRGALALRSRRRKPAPKNAKLPPMKTNASKRHRDRLNVELDHLTSLLPFSGEVTAHLDKLSVLRLSVGYLKVKSYFHAVLQNNTRSAPLGSANDKNGTSLSLNRAKFPEGEFLLQALNGFMLVVTADGTIFYASQTIQAFLGYHQSDVVHQSVYELVHVDDRDTFKYQLHFAFNPNRTSADIRADDAQSSVRASSGSPSSMPHYVPAENSSFLERSFCCRLRCLLDNTSGFLPLNFSGRLKHLPQGQVRAPPQLALFAIATPMQPPSVVEICTKTLFFQTKHRLDFAPVGIDSRGKLVLGYTETELLTTGSGYQFIHAADMMYCADTHLRTIKTGESGLAIFRLLTKTRRWLWVQASARVVFKEGRPDFIIVRQKVLTNEEGEEHLRQRKQQLPFHLATGEGVLYDFSVPGVPGNGEQTTGKPLNPVSLLGSLLQQDQSAYSQPQEPTSYQIEDLHLEQPNLPLEQDSLDSPALLSVPGLIQTAREDLTSEASTDSLEQILGDITDGGLEELEVEETDLKDWEKGFVRMNKERKYTPRELNSILANDVFLYADEALRRELGGFIQGSDQTGPHVSGNYSLFIEGRNPELSDNELKSHRTSNRSGFAEQIHLGNVRGKVAELKAGHASSSCPLSGTHQCATSPSCLPSKYSSHQCVLEVTDPGSQQTYTGLQVQDPSAWKQQEQLLQSSNCRLLAAGSVNSTAQSFHPQTQQLPSSCMYEEREGHVLNAATVRSTQIDPLLGPACSTVTESAPHFTLCCPGVEVACTHQGVLQLSQPNADVGNCSLDHLSGGVTGLGTAPSDCGSENESLQSSLFCWNSGAQILL